MNYWHDIKIGKNAPEEINCIIEIPKGSHNKYEIDKETGLIKLDRANYGPSAYPFDYGFAPQTLWDDNDALDVIIVSTHPLGPGILVNARPVAMLSMTDGDDPDDKIIAVPVDDKRFEDIKDFADLNKHFLKEVSNFFETYKMLRKDLGENPIKIEGYKSKTEAIEAIKRSQKLYQEKFGK